jgi:hypothetical protein
MRKIACIAMLSFLTVSCQNEQRQSTEQAETVVSLKSDAMENFENALKTIAKGQNRFIDSNKALNEEGVEILLPAATQLLIDNNISQTELKRMEKRKILKKGFSVYHENLAQYRNKIKSNQ